MSPDNLKKSLPAEFVRFLQGDDSVLNGKSVTAGWLINNIRNHRSDLPLPALANVPSEKAEKSGKIYYITTSLALAAMLTIAVLIKTDDKPVEKILTKGSNVEIMKGEKVKLAGLNALMLRPSKLEYLEKENGSHIIIHSGSVTFQLDHNIAKYWFDFPGGAFRDLGTAFTISVNDDETTIRLTEGKLEMTRHEEKAVILASPSFVIIPHKRKIMSDEKREIKPDRFSANQRRVTVMLTNGDRLIGKIKNENAQRIILEKEEGALAILRSEILKIEDNK